MRHWDNEAVRYWNLWTRRKRWFTQNSNPRNFGKREVLLRDWKPSPPQREYKHSILEFGTSNVLGTTVATLQLRKGWSKRERGFLLRTHLRNK